jgi:hypothetical protein
MAAFIVRKRFRLSSTLRLTASDVGGVGDAAAQVKRMEVARKKFLNATMVELALAFCWTGLKDGGSKARFEKSRGFS